MNRKQRILRGGFFMGILLLGFCLLAGVSQGQPLKQAVYATVRILGGAEFALQKAAVRLIFPGFLYTASEPAKEAAGEDPLAALAWEWFPVYTYVYNKEVYETQVEGGSVYEILLAREEQEEKQQDAKEELWKQMEEENQRAANAMQALPEEKENDEGDPGEILEQTPVPGVEYGEELLADFEFVKDSFYTVASSTTIGPEMLDGVALSAMDMKLKNDSSEPQILIYHTHSQEAFVDSVEGDPGTTIVGVGAYLTTLLKEKYGYNVIHNTNVYDFIDGKLDRNQAYSLALGAVEAILAQYPSIEVVIDLHRDGVDEKLHLVTDVNGKPTAQVMFFNGLSYSARNGPIAYLENPYIEENLAFSLQMKLAFEKYYPNLARKNYLNSLRYNLHVRPRSLLVEAGAQTNTLEEMMNAMEPLADVLHKVIGNGE